MKRLFSYLIIASLMAGVLLSTGCEGRSRVRFYVLSPTKDVNMVQVGGDRFCPVVGVGPVRMARYLDRPEIVTSSGGSKIFLSEDDRWAEPPD